MTKRDTAASNPAAEPAASSAARQLLTCLFVEDHTLIGQALAGVVRGLPGIGDVTLATTVAEAIAAAAELDVDLLIIDLALPDGHGLDVLRAVLKWHPDVACVVLSAGASEFTCPTELSATILAIVEKSAALDALRFEVEAIVRRRLGGLPQANRANPESLLRPRELQVFELIGKGMTTRQIAAAMSISETTVNTYRREIVAKLGAVGADLVRLATIYNLSHPGYQRAHR
jgi:DNA-binding NarL/FixJ family response regulator